MLIPFLITKIHRATVTASDLHYEGSIAIAKDNKARILGLISDKLTVAEVSSNTDKSFNKRDLELELNTMPDTGLIDNRHWLDSGSVKQL